MKRALVTAVAGFGLGSLLVVATGCSTSEPEHVHHRRVVHEAAAPSDDTAALKAQLDSMQKELAAAKGPGGTPPAAQPGAQAGPADNKAVGNQYWLQGKAAFEASDFNHAKDLLAKAVELDPTNEAAKKLLEDARLMSGEYAEPGDKGVRARRELEQGEAKVRAQVAEIETRYNRGVRAMNNKEYTKAVEEFTFVLQSISYFPYNVDLNKIKQQATKQLDEAKQLKAIQDAEMARDRERLTQKTAEQEERSRFEQRAKRIHQLFEQAQVALERNQFELAESYCNDILELDPNSFKTEDLKAIIRSARHDDTNKRQAATQLEEWRMQFESDNRKGLPQVDPVEFPGRDTWRRISQRQPRGFGAVETKLSEADQQVVDKMHTTKISLNFTEAPLPDVVTFLREYTRLNIIVDESAIENPAEKKITFRVDDIPFENAFNLILKMLDLAFKIDNGTIIITTKDKIAQDVRLELYDVQDLVVSLIDFPGPEIALAAPTEQQGPGGAQITEGQESKPFTGDDLKDLIKNNVAKGTWDTAPNSIEFSNGLLIVRHTPDTHRKVQKLLNDVRQSTGMVVTIESRFLTVSNHFLEEVGVDWRGLPSFPTDNLFNAGANVLNRGPDNRFTIDRDLNGDGVPDIVSSGMNGTFGNNQQADIRARVESSIEQDQVMNSFLTKTLSNAGGATLTYSIIDEIQAEAILRAVHKDERSKILTAPKVTVYNTQRANVFIARQIAYVKSYDIEIAQQAVIAKPIPALVQDGITLDVRPTISADRRYITLELRPTVAKLLQEIENSFIVTTISTLPFIQQVRIEVPDESIERARTTVTMPDGGTILFGGLTDIFDDDTQQNVPLLSEIPIINFFFSNKANMQQRRSLLTLVRAKITIAEELEKQVQSK